MNQMFINKPVPVDASPVERLMENLGHRNRLCVYTPELQKEKVFHLMGDNASNARLLVHFYAVRLSLHLPCCFIRWFLKLYHGSVSLFRKLETRLVDQTIRPGSLEIY